MSVIEMAKAASEKSAHEYKPVDLMAAFSTPPPDIDFVLPGFVAGTVGLIAAPGATGKSYWTLQAAMAIASAVAGGDVLGISPSQSGRVVYFAGEDPETILIRRAHAIGAHLCPESRVSISQHLTLISTVGKRMNIVSDEAIKGLINTCNGSRLIIFDTLSRIHLLDENSNKDMSFLISILEHIAMETGASVLFLHHVGKGSATAGKTSEQTSARGATALVDNARWGAYVSPMQHHEANQFLDNGRMIGEDRRSYYVRYGVNKFNYCAEPPPRWFKRSEGGVLVPADLTPVPAQEKSGGKQVRKSSSRARKQQAEPTYSIEDFENDPMPDPVRRFGPTEEDRGQDVDDIFGRFSMGDRL